MLAAPIWAAVDNPPFDRSPLDGLALRSIDTFRVSKDSPIRLKVAGGVYAGETLNRAIEPFEAARIMTGAAMPAGVDAMLPKEVVRRIMAKFSFITRSPRVITTSFRERT